MNIPLGYFTNFEVAGLLYKLSAKNSKSEPKVLFLNIYAVHASNLEHFAIDDSLHL